MPPLGKEEASGEQFAAELLDHASLAVVLDESVVFLGSAFGEGLEPVGIVGHAVFLCPLSDAFGHRIGDGAVEAHTVVDDVDQFLIDITGKVFVHLVAGEHIFPEKF